MLHMNKNIPPPTPRPKPSRVSVPLSHEALVAFEKLAKVQNLSTGKAIAEWLEETIDAVLYLSNLLEDARAAPRLVAQKMHAFALGLADESGALVEQIKAESRAARPVGTRSGSAGRGGRRSGPPAL